MRVQEVMTTDVITVREDQTKQQAALLLSQHCISGLPVVNDDNYLIGLVTEYDILSKVGRTVADLMTRSIISVSAETDVQEVRHRGAGRNNLATQCCG